MESFSVRCQDRRLLKDDAARCLDRAHAKSGSIPHSSASPVQSPSMRILLVSTYELGHQPLHVASPSAALRGAGHEVRAADAAIEPIAGEALDWAEAVAFSVPMHTAMRLAIRAAEQIKAGRPALPICFYGLYAHVGKESTLGVVADRLITGEYESALIAWADGIQAGNPAGVIVTDLGKSAFRMPDRTGLPDLERYAHLDTGLERRAVGYVEASHGCRQKCRHCPVPTVYDGRYRIVPEDVVVDDIAQLVEMGARHITFGDPDFLNGPRHSMRVIRAMHRRFPHLTFDITTKVDLILRHADVWEELANSGLQFVVSAFETTNDRILELLDKGHTVADEGAVVHMLRNHGVTIRPTWLPFTPWATLDDVADIVGFLDTHALDVDPIQLTIRLLIPDGSLLLDIPEIVPYLDGYDQGGLSWRWHAADPRVDELAARLSQIVQAAAGRPPSEILDDLRTEILQAAGRDPVRDHALAAAGPRLTEPWFC